MSQYSDFVKGYSYLYNIAYQRARKERRMIELYEAFKRRMNRTAKRGDEEYEEEINKIIAKIKELGLQ